jgi:hypothetical protein
VLLRVVRWEKVVKGEIERWEVGGGRYVCVPFVPKSKVLDLFK